MDNSKERIRTKFMSKSSLKGNTNPIDNSIQKKNHTPNKIVSYKE